MGNELRQYASVEDIAEVVKSNILFDGTLDVNSTNAVQNTAVANAIEELGSDINAVSELVGTTPVSEQIKNAVTGVKKGTISESDIDLLFANNE